MALGMTITRNTIAAIILAAIALAIPACFAMSVFNMDMNAYAMEQDSYAMHLMHMQDLSTAMVQDISATFLVMTYALFALVLLATLIAGITPIPQSHVPWHYRQPQLLPKPKWYSWLTLLVRSPSFVPTA